MSRVNSRENAKGPQGAAVSKRSAGLLLFRQRPGQEPEVLLVHPGGPYFTRKDAGAWTIPKGEPHPGEELETTARREVWEETGWKAEGPCLPLGSVRQRGGKEVHAFALAADLDPQELRSNTFSLEWPPRSGRQVDFPEIDRAAYFSLTEARGKMNAAQTAFLDALVQLLQGQLLERQGGEQ